MSLRPDQLKVLQALSKNPRTLEEIIARTSLTAVQARRILRKLESRKWISKTTTRRGEVYLITELGIANVRSVGSYL
ncbi:MAG: FaeA/PapI family transcriptional regulator [Candidatus Bathyarchaeia archaeon]